MTLTGQSTPARTFTPADFAAAIGWWRDAGLDYAFADEPRNLLAREAESAPAPVVAPAPSPVAAEPVPAKIVADASSLPGTLADFSSWWMSEPALDHGMVERRVAPRGAAGARLMVIVPHPESGDETRLLSGPDGLLLDAIMAALGLKEGDFYLASCLPRHTLLPDWADLARAGLGDVLAQHVRLVGPQRVLLLGSNISSLLGHDPAKSDPPFTQICHGGAMWPAMAAPGLDILAARPRRKAQLWRSLLDWIE